jgi:MFS family permease
LAAFLMTAYYGPLVAATQSVTPPNMRALSQAVLLLTFNLFGLGLGPWLAGMLSDALTATYDADGLRYALAAALLPSALSALIFMYAAPFYAAHVAEHRQESLEASHA